ncbi:S1 family peptidase [Rubrobacter tropicus]|uniref:S1 family peptidase n=1 Tax=Rubrobacter tropicus TaxID=2653851 RepID=UPI00140B86D6|nr:serine protease [Rubrobacter tropicus]
MKVGGGSDTGNALRYHTRYLLAVVFAALLSLGIAVPVFAAEETTGGGDSTTNGSRIVGGTAVPDGKYKFIAALRDVTRGSSVYQQQFCGATLIDRDSVLTAAHCVQGTTRTPLRVTVGITALNKKQGQTRRVATIFRHPKYFPRRNEANDVAVLKLSSPVRNVAPVKIPSVSFNTFEQPGRTATIAGWGNTERQGPFFQQPDNFPYRMREAKVPLVRDGVGKRVYGDNYVTPRMVAAGKENKDTCQGDSGGPMFVPTSTGRYQIGITSFGAGCGTEGFPGVYTETNAEVIRNFIATAMRR